MDWPMYSFTYLATNTDKDACFPLFSLKTSFDCTLKGGNGSSLYSYKIRLILGWSSPLWIGEGEDGYQPTGLLLEQC